MPCHKFVHFQNGVEKTEACGRCECCGCLWTLLVLLLCVWLKIIIISHPPHKIFHTSICQIFHKNNKMSSLCDGWKIWGLFRRNTFFCQNLFAVRFFFQKETKNPIMISSPGSRLRRKSSIFGNFGMGGKKGWWINILARKRGAPTFPPEILISLIFFHHSSCERA